MFKGGRLSYHNLVDTIVCVCVCVLVTTAEKLTSIGMLVHCTYFGQLKLLTPCFWIALNSLTRLSINK